MHGNSPLPDEVLASSEEAMEMCCMEDGQSLGFFCHLKIAIDFVFLVRAIESVMKLRHPSNWKIYAPLKKP